MAVKKMNSATSELCGHSDWRLPNRNELRSLANYGQSNVANWLNAQGFSNVTVEGYWSSTTYAGGTGNAWYVNLSGTVFSGYSKTNATSFYIWPVRGGTSSAVAVEYQ